jgi:CubicO group peptidase (beta-lactamase class C family)
MVSGSRKVYEYLQSEIEHGSFPGAQYLIGEGGEVTAEGALGHASIEPERRLSTVETIYDLASLTKPLVTSLLLVKMYERGLLDLDAPVGDYLDEFKSRSGSNESGVITLKRLMTHTSGLPNWRPLYLECRDRKDVAPFIARLARDEQGAPQLIYSDLNYVLLGFALERATGERLDRLAEREIFMPLGLKDTMFNPPPELRHRIAATERGQQFERANAIADAGVPASRPEGYGWREGVIWGEVHDGNAHFLGGVAGHAGLFSTAREVFRIANQFLSGSRLLKPESLPLFTENLTPGFDTARSIGWILCSTADCSGGPGLPPTGIGHNGFTGTSVWMDAARRRVFILLTNRVHPRVTGIDIKSIRQRFNMLARESLNEVSSL